MNGLSTKYIVWSYFFYIFSVLLKFSVSPSIWKGSLYTDLVPIFYYCFGRLWQDIMILLSDGKFVLNDKF